MKTTRSETTTKTTTAAWKKEDRTLTEDEALLEDGAEAVDSLAESLASVADQTPAEQRFRPKFTPNVGPFGQRPPPPARRPSSLVNAPPPPPAATPTIASSGVKPRSPYNAGGVSELADNSLLGSGNFEVLSGGLYEEDTGSPYKPIKTNNNHYNHHQNNHNKPVHNPWSLGPDSFGPYHQDDQFNPPLAPVVPKPTPKPVVSEYPPSFFDGDFFSNFRDFADVNQDYRQF